MNAVLLVNLGTPAAPTAAAVRAYLAEFLGDRRVVDLPRALWLPILHGVILRTRPAKSAAKYAKIWTPQGSPLKVHTERQAVCLQEWMDAQNLDVRIYWAMRYGAPAIPAALDELAQAGARRIIVVPLYPQFSVSTTMSVQDAVATWQARQPHAPEIITVTEYHADPGYIHALAANIEAHWQQQGRSEHLLMSFHGIPQRAVDKGDPYAFQCERTAQKLAEALHLAPRQWRLTYQSRFGRAQWLQPYTQATLEQMASEGARRIDIVCPGFVADCLETLEEIAMECRAAFIDAGGEELRYIPCVNAQPAWINALGEIIRRQG